MRAIELTAFGDPVTNLRVAELPEPLAPGANEVLIGMEFAPVNFNDLLLIRGTFPQRPALPSPVGNEGAGKVLAVGAGVTHLTVGDRVVPPLYSATWRERMVVAADELFPLPAEVDAKQAAMLRINPPTAALLLSEHGGLKAGDWVIQNAASSGVGLSVIAFAKARGFKTINLVRRVEAIAEVKTAGGDIVLLDNNEVVESISDLTQSGKIHLAIDGVSGESTVRLLQGLSQGGALDSYAFSGGEVSIHTDLRPLLRKAVSLHAFYQARPQYDSQMPTLLRESAEFVRAGKLKQPVAAIYPMSRISEAAQHAIRGGKVLLDLQSAD
ncbi:zinc-dependent alcohol dehydrogenase family protein (plasmid) [Caballeronia sp. NK8]|uniref:zinc-dependent alcohol dehydrogenase family protein n=1 Tax=Caballeronia sp. NK8 TaxID=140098 RepID=UPI001BB6A73F|nr:zinc-dependent alcohol dehydrogenase family protein [Caballeronia sp. NK8]BCQ29196.1 zinc-dependent alcohol dehydrogenase family protein [Caballeronia sp. NK8]